jgi:murein DD-endopeptidase MepM/ murein hydrolase activator NlpD
MRKFSLELPKYRLQLHMKLIKRRKPLVDEPFVPTISVVNKKYRSGTLLGKVARHISGHKNVKRYFAANLSALMIVGTFLPVAQGSVQAAALDAEPDQTIIQTQNTLVTEKSIQYPLENIRLNQGYGIFHPGIDLGSEIGDPIKAIKAGVVTEAESGSFGYGNTVVIDHGKGLISRYAHLSKIEVKVGDSVTTTTEIGTIGVTGRSTGPHLHLEIRQNGMALNPLSVLSR